MEVRATAAATPDLPGWLARAGGIAGAFAIVASVFVPWFSVPGLADDPHWSIVFRVLTAALCLIAGLRLPRLLREPQQLVPILAGYLGALLLFPYFIAVWSPTHAGAASWLNAQHESLTASSGDLYMSQERRDELWRQRVDIVNRPLFSDVVAFPDWDEIHGGVWLDVAECFGAAPWFALFVRRGWVLALLGCIACSIAVARELRVRNTPTPLRFRRLLLTAVSLLLLAVTPPMLAVGRLRMARTAIARGDYAAALHDLSSAARFLPALREDGTYVMQRGLLDAALGADSAEARLYRARLTERRGFDEQAAAGYLAGLERAPSAAVQREYLKSLLSLAADAMNSGELGPAKHWYSVVLLHDPLNLRANYALQLVAVRTVDAAQLAELQTRLATTYRDINSPLKKAVLSLSNENGAFTEIRRGEPDAAWLALARARKP